MAEIASNWLRQRAVVDLHHEGCTLCGIPLATSRTQQLLLLPHKTELTLNCFRLFQYLSQNNLPEIILQQSDIRYV